MLSNVSLVHLLQHLIIHDFVIDCYGNFNDIRRLDALWAGPDTLLVC